MLLWNRTIRAAILGTMGMISSLTAPFAQANLQMERFVTSCKDCWPGWIELARPEYGVGPSVYNRLGFIFINGFDPDPWRNRQHLQWTRAEDLPSGAKEITATLQFNNATMGGKLALRDGSFLCLRDVDVTVPVTNELFILTLRDSGRDWYGAFLGDLTALDPNFVPDVDEPERRSYSAFGLLRHSDAGLELLALEVIPLLRRFTPIVLTLTLDEDDPQAPRLRAEMMLRTGARHRVQAFVDPESLLPAGRIGIIYVAASARPCASLIQREIALLNLQVR